MRTAAIVVLALVIVPAAAGSTWVADDAASPGLRVDASGNAVVSWSSDGSRHSLLLPPAGKVLPGGRLNGPDVSRAATAPVPFARVVRSAPNGWMYALQTWPSQVPGGAVELHFSRWRGAPTVAHISATEERLGILLSGSVAFAGRPIPTTSRTPAGKQLREYAYLDAWASGGWHRLGAAAIRPGGTFRRLAPMSRSGVRFRVVVEGPNIGSTFAPDALATTVFRPRP